MALELVEELKEKDEVFGDNENDLSESDLTIDIAFNTIKRILFCIRTKKTDHRRTKVNFISKFHLKFWGCFENSKIYRKGFL